MKIIAELTKHDVAHMFWENGEMIISPRDLISVHFKDTIRARWQFFNVVYFITDAGEKIRIQNEK